MLLAAIALFAAALLVVVACGRDRAQDDAQVTGTGVILQQAAPTATPVPQLMLPDTSEGVHRAIVFLRCAQETGWTGGSQTCTNYSARTSLASLEDKLDTGFSIYNAPVLKFINPVLASKIGISLQLTRSPAFPFDYSKFNPSQWRQGSQPLSFDWWLRNHPDWIVYTCDRRVAWEYGDAPLDPGKPAWVPLDVTSPEVRLFYWETYVRPALDHGAPLVFFDNLAIHNTWQRCGHYDKAGAWVQQFSADYKDAAYQAAAFSWIEWLYGMIKAHKPDTIVAYNYSPAESNDPPEVRDRVFNSLDMIFDEAGFNYWGNYKAIDALWRRKKDVVDAAHSKGKAIFFSQTSFVTDPATQTSRDEKNWGLANYLLFKGKHDFIGWSGVSCTNCGPYNFNDYGYYVDFPEYYAPLGAPAGEMFQAHGVWMRDFANGRVVVNPDGLKEYDVPLDESYSDLWGGAVAKTIRMPSQSAIVLVKAAPPTR
jgi:hypothetical protein